MGNEIYTSALDETNTHTREKSKVLLEIQRKIKQ